MGNMNISLSEHHEKVVRGLANVETRKLNNQIKHVLEEYVEDKDYTMEELKQRHDN